MLKKQSFPFSQCNMEKHVLSYTSSACYFYEVCSFIIYIQVVHIVYKELCNVELLVKNIHIGISKKSSCWLCPSMKMGGFDHNCRHHLDFFEFFQDAYAIGAYRDHLVPQIITDKALKIAKFVVFLKKEKDNLLNWAGNLTEFPGWQEHFFPSFLEICFFKHLIQWKKKRMFSLQNGQSGFRKLCHLSEKKITIFHSPSWTKRRMRKIIFRIQIWCNIFNFSPRGTGSLSEYAKCRVWWAWLLKLYIIPVSQELGLSLLFYRHGTNMPWQPFFFIRVPMELPSSHSQPTSDINVINLLSLYNSKCISSPPYSNTFEIQLQEI